MITTPQQSAADYGVVPDAPDAAPKHGTSVQLTWDTVSVFNKSEGDYPNDFKLSEEPQLVAFPSSLPFHEYRLFWLEGKEGKKSYVSLGDDDPLLTIAGAIPRGLTAFNVVNFSVSPAQTQILHAGKKLFELLGEYDKDPRRGPLTSSLWAITRSGVGVLTQYSLDRVRSDELDVWGLTPEQVRETVDSAKRYTPEDIYVASYEEHERIARELVSR